MSHVFQIGPNIEKLTSYYSIGQLVRSRLESTFEAAIASKLSSCLLVSMMQEIV